MAVAFTVGGCAYGDRVLVARTWHGIPALAGTGPSDIRQALDVPLADCRAWELRDPSVPDGTWEVHVRVPAARASALAQQLKRLAGMEAVTVAMGGRFTAKPSAPALEVTCR